ncbi:MAG: DUF4249 family protein [Bacteroidota bacterium]
MKHLIVLFFSLITLVSCDNELNLTTEWENIPVVYGLLSPSDQIQYIRVEKAFLDPNTNAFELAQITDSIYYQDAIVQLERPSTNEVITLERVDASKEGLVRDEGVFVTDPNFLYRLDLTGSNNLGEGEEVRLTISDNQDQLLASSEIKIVEEFELLGTQPGDPVNFGDYDRPIRVGWRVEGEEASIYNVQIVINYEESAIDNANEFENKSVTWTVAKNLVRNNPDRMSIELSGEEFYVFLGGALEPAPIQNRRLKDIDVLVTAGGRELAEFIRIRQANTGLTSSQVTPTFDNIEGGLGLLSSTFQASRKGIKLFPEALDSLSEGFYTNDLGFLK